MSDKYVVLESPGPIYGIHYAKVILFDTLSEAQAWVEKLPYDKANHDPYAFVIKKAVTCFEEV